MRTKIRSHIPFLMTCLCCCPKLESFPKTIKLYYLMSPWCRKCARWLQTWSTAKLQAQFTTSAVWKSMWWFRIHQYGCHSPWMTQTSTLWRATHVWLHKNSNLHILLVLEADVLPTMNAFLLYNDDCLIVCSEIIRVYAITASIPDYLHLFCYIKITVSFPSVSYWPLV